MLQKTSQMLSSTDKLQSRFGTRSVLAIFFCLCPAYFVLLLPVIPLYLGHIEVPSILLSSIMSAKASYQSIYIMGFGVPLFVGTFLLTQAGSHLKSCGVCSAAINAFLTLITGACGTGLLMLLAFCFESDNREDLESRIHAFLHNAGTIVYFGGAGVACWLYITFIQPEGEKLSAIHPADSRWLKILGNQMVAGTVLIAFIRIGHLTWPHTWAIPMLIVECYVIGLAISLAIVGHFRLFMHLDAIDPLLDLSFIMEKKKQS